ncbi:hypothetical protein ONZ45_g661 [Pleurotus djamor]|nr:hypothetical protein ONZ45_g661 [Pleurotus djamor]
MRPISLHVSALNDSEYQFYTISLIDLAADDAEKLEHGDSYDQLVVGVREVRAWLKGRFSHIQPSKIDEILRLFSPNLSAADTLSGGQFFAALRLAVHVEGGKDVDRALAFSQAFPRTSPPSAPASPLKRILPVPPATAPMAPVASSSSNPFTHVAPPTTNPFYTLAARSQSQPSHKLDGPPQKLPPLPPRNPSTHQPPPRHASQQPGLPPPESRGHVSTPSLSKAGHVTSALMKQSLQASKVGQTMKKAEEQLEKERILQVLKSSNSHSRNRSNSPNKPPPPPPPRPTSSSSSVSDAITSQQHIPPLPRRQVRASSPHASTTSLEQIAFARPSMNTEPIHAHNASPFKTPDQPFKEASYFARSPSISPERPNNKDLPPPKHPKRKPPPPIDSALSSTSSVSALSSADSNTPSFRDRQQSSDAPLTSNDSPTSRVFRSKSVHYPSPPPPVPPPLRKRRPESVQVVPGGNIFDQLSQQPSSPFGVRGPRSEGGASNGGTNGANLSRHVSMSASTPSPKGSYYRRGVGVDNDHTPLANFQRTLATFQPKLDALQPKLDKVRYKAEAGLSRRGFVREGHRWEGEDEEGLMDDGADRRSRHPSRPAVGADDDWDRTVGMDGGAGIDSGVEDDDGPLRVRGRRLKGPRDPGGPLLSDEQDNLKLPPGDGWKPL